MSLARRVTLPAAILSLAIGAAAYAQQEFSGAINARQGHMQIMAFNVGILGNMARGNTEYDAAAATTAASNLAALAMVDGRGYWVPGSDNGAVETTRALPAIWEDMAGFGADWQAYGEAVTGLQAAAGNGLDALRGAMGPLGNACGTCHDDFRQPSD
ncbi:MAG: cytochrome c [Roseicyclus sp.]|nr:cytochrome c [Roseicyclus sp.]MBO6922423.1 cytochrome c [Roseicyclus sp.]